MTDTDEILLFLVEDILGSHRPTRANNPQKYFNCKSPKCIYDRNKYNLAYNADNRVFKCFKCNTQGSIHSLVQNFGNKGHGEKLKLAIPYYIPNKNYFSKPNFDLENITCELPVEYLPLSKFSETFKYKQALDYVTNVRKLTMDQIKDYLFYINNI